MDISILGKQIANGRKEKGLSQVTLAELLSVTPQAVSKWERSESIPDIFMLAKISDIFDIYDIGYFLGKEQDSCPCGFCDCENNSIKKGGNMNYTCENFTTIEQFVEYWKSCSLKGLQKIAKKYEVKFNESDKKEEIIEKMKKEMLKNC